MSVAVLEEHSPEKLFKELVRLHRQATAARDKRAEAGGGGPRKKFNGMPPWRVLDAEMANVVKTKLVPTDWEIICYSGRMFNEDDTGRRVLSALFRIPANRVQQLREVSGPDGVFFQRSNIGSDGAVLKQEKQDEEFVPFQRGKTIAEAIVSTASLEGA
eukprot:2797455-Pyramimonas_sp.AAC.1